MSDAPKSRPAKRSTNRKAASEARFNPAVFLETTARGSSYCHAFDERSHLCPGRRCRYDFLYQEGEDQSHSRIRHGKEAVLAVLGADEFLGEGCLIGQPKRLATAAAMTESVTMRVEKAEILRVLHDEPAFSEMFVAHILARSARVEDDLVDQLFNSTEKRLAPAAASLGQLRQGRTAEPVIAKITQETLAEMIGTTRSRVSHFMNKFRKLGFIDYNGRLEVHSSLLSVVLTEQPRTVNPPE